MEQVVIDFLIEYTTLDRTAATLAASALIPTAVGLGAILIALFFYSTKSFNDHLTYSGNQLVSRNDALFLELSTYHVLPLEDLLPSNLAFRLSLLYALGRVRKSDPFVRMSPRDMDVLQPAMINGLSMLYSDGLLAWQKGERPNRTEVLVALSYEKHDKAKSRKMRVIVASENLLKSVLDPRVQEMVHFEREHQRNRLLTLVKMAEHWQAESSLSPDDYHLVRTVRIYRPN